MIRHAKQCHKSYVILIAVLAAFCATIAEEPAAPEIPRPMFELRKRGTVDVTRDESGEVSSIKLIVTSYQITLDEGSKPLEDMDGQKVRALGTYERINDEGWFTVSSVELIEPDEPETADEAEEDADEAEAKDAEQDESAPAD